MDLTKRKKLLLTTSLDGDVIVAEVKPTQARNRGEYFVSEDFVRLNERNGTLTNITKQMDNGGRVYILSADLAVG